MLFKRKPPGVLFGAEPWPMSSRCIQNMYHYPTKGKVLLPQVTNGSCMFSQNLDFIQTHIDDLLCITKGSPDDHLSKLKRVFIRLCDA